MSADELDLDTLLEGQSFDSTGTSDGSNQNICLTFCFSVLSNGRFKPIGSCPICGPSPEAIGDIVGLIIRANEARGFQVRAQQGECG